MPGLNTSASFASAADTASAQTEPQTLNQSQSEPQEKEKPKFFFRERYAKLGVKGNFMPLAAQPKNVDIAEWLAHQGNRLVPWPDKTTSNLLDIGMEQYRLVAALLQCIQEVDANTGLALCNPKGCPVMSAGR